jgi:hypothetical protein
VNLKNKGVSLSGIGRGKEFFFGWGWMVGGKKSGVFSPIINITLYVCYFSFY